MTRRITITLPDELVSAIDEEAAEEGLSRSALIREASSRYVAGMQAADADVARREAVDRTLGFLDELEDAPVLDDRSVAEVLREMRGPLGDSAAWDEDAGEGP
jgi:predicted transcriptional regulator